MRTVSRLVFLLALTACTRDAPRCPVCGMDPAKYPRWRASTVLADDSTVELDSPRCLFRFLGSPGRHRPGAKVGPDARVRIVEYYSQRPADARSLHYVTGSDVVGPMGPDSVPIRGLDEARQFLADHAGKRILTFREAVQNPP